MSLKCCSSRRCALLSCHTCAWRYAGRVGRRILAFDPRHLHAIEIEAPISSLADFWVWRVEARNLIDHRRRTSRWWRDVGLSVWLSKDGHLRGIVSLGAITAEEFHSAVGRRWPVTLRAVDPVTVREEVYFAIRPGVIADVGSGCGRYQPLKFHVGPMRGAVPKVPEVTATTASYWSEPMPILI